jgi:uncharacterized protein with NAD-binding domain and iron-sulfur cluster
LEVGGEDVQDSGQASACHYIQVVISASHGLVHRDRDGIVHEVCEDLRSAFPEAQSAKLLHSRVVNQPAAVFCCEPGLDALRPKQTTRISTLFLAGDWTATGWPATMEGTVRSGYLAVEGIRRVLAAGSSGNR